MTSWLQIKPRVVALNREEDFMALEEEDQNKVRAMVWSEVVRIKEEHRDPVDFCEDPTAFRLWMETPRFRGSGRHRRQLPGARALHGLPDQAQAGGAGHLHRYGQGQERRIEGWAMSEAAPAQDPATPDPLAYQRECGMADTMFTKLLTLMKEGSPDGTDARITGAMTAIIRHLAEQAHQPQQTVTTRDVMASPDADHRQGVADRPPEPQGTGQPALIHIATLGCQLRCRAPRLASQPESP